MFQNPLFEMIVYQLQLLLSKADFVSNFYFDFLGQESWLVCNIYLTKAAELTFFESLFSQLIV